MQALNPLTMPLIGQSLIEASAGTGKTYTTPPPKKLKTAYAAELLLRATHCLGKTQTTNSLKA